MMESVQLERHLNIFILQEFNEWENVCYRTKTKK